MEPIQIITCDQWGARPARSGFPVGVPKGIVIHNTETPSRDPGETSQVEMQLGILLCKQIQAYHMDGHGWGDTGQHFTVTRGGLIFEGRHQSLTTAKAGQIVQGAHAGVARANRELWGIECEGNYVEGGELTIPQWKALVDLCAHLACWGHFDTSNTVGHKDVKKDVAGGTDCPGHLEDVLGQLRQDAHDRKVLLMEG